MSQSSVQTESDRWAKFSIWLRRSGLSRKLALILVLATFMSGVATFVAMTHAGPDGSDPSLILNLLYVDAVFLLLLGVLITRRLIKLQNQRSKGVAGSKLQTKLVLFFSLLAAVPAILMAIFAGLYLNLGMQSWFSERVSSAVQSSLTIAEAYRDEHVRSIQIDALSLANNLNRNAPALSRSRLAMERQLNKLAFEENLAEVAVIDGEGRVIAQSFLSLSLAFNQISREALRKADNDEVVITYESENDRTRAVVKLDRYLDSYLYIGRFLSPDIGGSINQVRSAYSQYVELEKQREGIHISFVMIFFIIALMLLLAAAWLGLTFANRLASPLSDLISAADGIAKGDLSARVEKEHASDEIGMLGRAFNRMAGEIESQRGKLVETNKTLDERNRFTETVLDGVSAGVVGLGANGEIHLLNRFATLFLDALPSRSHPLSLKDILPELEDLFQQAQENPSRAARAEVALIRNGQVRTINAAIAAEILEGELIGYVLTFDDITELQSAQRRAAWANVARRIAHEIKNPLTPIQLSAERLKRKYLKSIKDDPETFTMCTETIIRQVDEMRRMVDEFSSFARMPRPVLKEENISKLCHEIVFLEQNRTPTIRFEGHIPDKDLYLICDRNQVSRLLTNLMKNAAEAIFAKHDLELEDAKMGETEEILGNIHLKLEEEDGKIVILITDDGKGFPYEERESLLDPYVTTRKKGTGLGLAISKKIMEEHQGKIVMKDNPDGGAIIELRFPELEEHSTSLSDNSQNQETETQQDPMAMAVRLVTDGA